MRVTDQTEEEEEEEEGGTRNKSSPPSGPGPVSAGGAGLDGTRALGGADRTGSLLKVS